MSENDGNFNDAELQDIMNEIESLEKEFQDEQQAPSAEAETVEETTVEEPVAEETIEVSAEETVEEQPEEEEEVEDFSNEAEDYEEDETSAEPSNVVAMPQRTEAPTSGHEGFMQFSGQGNMDLQLNFQLGSQTATVHVAEGGLKVTMAGVELNLNESGCEVEMQGGVKFSVPLTAGAGQAKKAA